MNFKFAKLPENPTKEDIKKEINRLSMLAIDAQNKNQALKIILNSVYGVIGFNRFILYNKIVAEAIAVQSADLLKYIINTTNEYFRNEWHKDTEVHEKMGISDVKKVDFDIVAYGDTDSYFLKLGDIYKQVTKPDGMNFNDFVLKFGEVKLNGYKDEIMEKYIDIYHGIPQKPNSTKALKLDLEQICHGVLWTSKKKYVKDVSWDKGIEFEHLEDLQIKGLEANQSKYHFYIRNHLKEEIIPLIMAKGEFDIEKLTRILKNIKTEFNNITNLEKISKYERVGDYNKFVLNDTEKITIAPNCKPHVRGAAVYNYLINKEGLKNKYPLIKGGEKVYWYHLKNKNLQYFSFKGDNFPYELSKYIEVDINEQFDNVMLSPVNNMIKAMGLEKITPQLVIFKPLSF